MIKDFDYFLTADHFFNIAVQLAQAGLLAGEVSPAAPAAVTDIQKHGGIAHHHQQGKLPVQHKQHGQRAHNLDEALNDHGKAVVQRVGDGVHVICEIAHHIAVAAGIEKAQGKRLDMGKQIPADVEQHLLRHVHHRLCVTPRRQHARAINKGRGRHAPHQGGYIRARQAVHHRPYHIGAEQVGAGAYGNQRRHREQQKPVPPHIAQELAHSKAKVLGPLTGRLARHRRRLPSSGNDRFPDKSRLCAAAARACRTHAAARPPAPQSGLCPSQK